MHTPYPTRRQQKAKASRDARWQLGALKKPAPLLLCVGILALCIVIVLETVDLRTRPDSKDAPIDPEATLPQAHATR